ncbi:MAG: EamA family transporter RarD [Treponema sp.]|jgi:chloramphenicol-sensitive protein RarD|nr:EamA family transporter RarD [Treponema sp.]
MNTHSKGYLYAISAYLMWGILPIYWKLLSNIGSLQILGFRILFSLLLIGAILMLRKNFTWLLIFREKKLFLVLVLGAITLSFNWGFYIWAVNSGHTLETAIGYYINPLISIIFGLCFFREKLKTMQWIAFILAAAGVLVMTFYANTPPWIALGLALSFGLYGLLKKTVTLSALESLGAETLIAAPLGLLFLFTSQGNSGGFFSIRALYDISKLPLSAHLLLLGCGAVTSLPMYLFAKSTKLLPLSTVGFVQFISPTLAFFEGVFIFREPFPFYYFIVFGCIWIAVILYIISLKAIPDRKKQNV